MKKYNCSKLFSGSHFSSNDVYIIAEIGVNHNGNIEIAKKLMEEAVLAGADAVKFQKRNLNKIYVPDLLKDTNSAEWSFQYLLPQLKQLELSEQEYFELDKYARKLDVDLIVTPFDEDSLDFIKKLKLAALKIGSPDLTHWPLIKKAAKTKLPLILSTGLWDEHDVADTSNFVKSITPHFALLHCQSTYPAPLESINLWALQKLKKYTKVVGYSGHERGITICLAAVGLGAKIIEKHITMDRMQYGPDHRASLGPKEFRSLVTEIRKVEKALGNIRKKVSEGEKLNRHTLGKSLTVNKDLPAGYIVRKRDIIFMSPGKGIPPSHLRKWVGKKLARPKKQYDFLIEDDFSTRLTIDQWQKFNFSKPWGVKCRFHDYGKYKILNTPVIEFHCSDKDILGTFSDGNKKTALVIHSPEIIGRELFDLCSKYPDRVEKSIVVLNNTIKKAKELKEKFSSEKPKIVIHMGGMAANTEHYDTRRMMRIAAKSLSKINLKGVELLPENLPPRPWYLGGQWYQHAFMRPEEILKFCKTFSLGMTLDICHAYLYCNYFKVNLMDYIKILLPIVRHMHISDAYGIDGEGIQIHEGEINFDKIIKILEKANTSWVPEIWSGHINHGKGFHEALKRLSKYNSMI